mmetsp:Transcript_109195/g.348566  ORF Transcript_109195/g.348566 Transcript_109195/m.348566 type:complete len:209 (+) Transcript_109195:75-701(+)
MSRRGGANVSSTSGPPQGLAGLWCCGPDLLPEGNNALVKMQDIPVQEMVWNCGHQDQEEDAYLDTDVAIVRPGPEEDAEEFGKTARRALQQQQLRQRQQQQQQSRDLALAGVLQQPRGSRRWQSRGPMQRFRLHERGFPGYVERQLHRARGRGAERHLAVLLLVLQLQLTAAAAVPVLPLFQGLQRADVSLQGSVGDHEPGRGEGDLG